MNVGATGLNLRAPCTCLANGCRDSLWDQPFAHFSGARATSLLRSRLGKIGFETVVDYRLHDFRRGHAQDLVASGAALVTILKAGDWRSAAFLVYVDKKELETRAVIAAVCVAAVCAAVPLGAGPPACAAFSQWSPKHLGISSHVL